MREGARFFPLAEWIRIMLAPTCRAKHNSRWIKSDGPDGGTVNSPPTPFFMAVKSRDFTSMHSSISFWNMWPVGLNHAYRSAFSNHMIIKIQNHYFSLETKVWMCICWFSILSFYEMRHLPVYLRTEVMPPSPHAHHSVYSWSEQTVNLMTVVCICNLILLFTFLWQIIIISYTKRKSTYKIFEITSRCQAWSCLTIFAPLRELR
jgi:hypothetical protein